MSEPAEGKAIPNTRDQVVGFIVASSVIIAVLGGLASCISQSGREQVLHIRKGTLICDSAAGVRNVVNGDLQVYTRAIMQKSCIVSNADVEPRLLDVVKVEIPYKDDFFEAYVSGNSISLGAKKSDDDDAKKPDDDAKKSQ